MNYSVLIIEDDLLLGDILSKKLEIEGYQVTLERDGAAGLKRAYDLHPSLVLLDIMLPTVNGYEILEKRLEDPVLSKIPFVIMSNSGQDIETARLDKLCATARIVKSTISPEEVASIVQTCLADTAEAVAPATADSVAATTSTNKRILWVEDDTFLREVLATKLMHAGYEPITAHDGDECLAIVHSDAPAPCVILLDVTLPGINGLDLIPLIRANEKYKNVPILILSNISQESDKKKAEALGVAKYLVKAENDPSDIMNIIASVLAAK